jgi:hypothetical protein
MEGARRRPAAGWAWGAGGSVRDMSSSSIQAS